ncbi:ArsR/SmtB family transcription factor [Dermacoccus abyssi]|uniref:ArsR/SmtB family transcription factor n=1 Tax=Dermacoccus abyssi TaxID=322596 RepID=UPI002AD40F30|nr:metalloregulator ArsR/SmtB family transcription factor [Dermacoccus abyssi]
MSTPAEFTCAPAADAALLPLDDANRRAELLKAIADPVRLRLLTYLAATPDGTVCACHLPIQLGITQPTLSHHLKKLTDTGLLMREQRGRWAHYTVVRSRLDEARSALEL